MKVVLLLHCCMTANFYYCVIFSVGWKCWIIVDPLWTWLFSIHSSFDDNEEWKAQNRWFFSDFSNFSSNFSRLSILKLNYDSKCWILWNWRLRGFKNQLLCLFSFLIENEFCSKDFSSAMTSWSLTQCIVIDCCWKRKEEIDLHYVILRLFLNFIT